jgi:poly-D-alanine transfer protein DltD
MIVAVHGTKDFDDYQVFLRAMGVALSGMEDEDKEFIVYAAGPAKVNSFVSEFCNLSERGMKSRGRKIKFIQVPPWYIEENIKNVNYFAFLSKPKEALTKLVSTAEQNNIEVGIFRY